MAELIKLIAPIIISLELFFIAGTTGYFSQKFSIGVFVRTTAIWSFSAFVLILGSYIGVWAKSILMAQSSWYATTILFAMAVKYIYVSVRLKKARNTINPLDNAGLLILLLGIGVNAFFLSFAGGLITGSIIPYIWIIPTLLFPLAGLLYGIVSEKLDNFRIELLYAAVLILIAAIILNNS